MLTNSKAQVNTQDSLALVNIYNTTNGSAWTQKWIRTQPVSTWFGVTVTSGRVTGLSLPNNNLAGQLLSTNIAKLTKLKVLQLQNNHIGDGLPGGIGSMPDLELLDLSFNNLSGNILASFFNNLPNLQKFNVAGNDLRGWIPANISNSIALTEINISNNRFSNKIPATINNLTNLTKFLAANNELVSPMPAGVLCSSSVQVDISGNAFNFSGLECLAANPNATYNNQKELEVVQSGSRLSVTAGGTLSNNTYTWYRNTGATPYYVSNGTTNKLNTAADGKYWAVITNSAAPQLTLRSDTILLTGPLTSDSLALVDFYNNTSGLNWVLTNPVSTWEGVTLENGRVAKLEAGGLSGIISASLGKLSELKLLYIDIASEGTLTGNIPGSIANLTKLEELVIGQNNLTGPIPDSIGRNQQKLFYMIVANNPLTGTIPSGLGYASNLQELYIRETQVSGTIPVFLKNLPLSNLDLSNNRLTGSIPDSLTSRANLFLVDLSNNQLTGSIPSSIRAIAVYLSNNQLSGSLPDSLISFGNSVRLSHNQLTGAIPNLSYKVFGDIDISYNNLTYVDPSNCASNTITGDALKINNNRLNFTGLECITASANVASAFTINPQQQLPVINDNATLKVSAGGTLANNTYKWYNGSTLVATKTGDSSFTYTTLGDYHAAVTNSTVTGVTLYSDTVNIAVLGSLHSDSLALVDIYNEVTSGLNWVLTDPVSTWEGVTIRNGRVAVLLVGSLSGTLSPSLGNLNALTTLSIDEYTSGTLTGSIPTTIANLTNLEQLVIGANNLTGAIPDDLGRNQPDLSYLFIVDNPLTGTIPSGLEYATSLSEVYIQGTQISGTIPTFFKNLPVGNLVLASNKLTGSVPDSLGATGFLYNLELIDNQLTGPLPSSIKAEYIDLSSNQLSGSLPDNLKDLGSWIKLSNNRFTGAIPNLTGGLYTELDISKNLLESVHPSNCSSNVEITGSPLNISNNKLNFTGLECIKSSFYGTTLIISPQQTIPIINENPVLKAAAGGTPANNTYKWYKGAALLATNTGDSTLTVTTPGLYYCIVTNSSVPGVELRTDSVNISTVSSRKMQGVNDGAANGIYNGKLSVYPNPANTGSVYIKGLQKAESVLLYNAAGQLVKQWQNVNGNQQLNISGINNGVYMLKIVEKGNQTMLKFIKE